MNTSITNITTHYYNATTSFNLGHILAVDLSSVLFGIGLLLVAALIGYAFTRKLSITLLITTILGFGMATLYSFSALWLAIITALTSFTILVFAYEIFVRGK